MSECDDWEDISYVLRGKQRNKVIQLINSPVTVTSISRKADLSLSEASRVLRGFFKKGLVECKNNFDHLGRIYVLTDKGARIKSKIDNDMNVFL